MNDYNTRKMYALLRDAGVSKRDDQHAVMSWIICSPVGTSKEMDHIQARCVVDVLSYWQRMGDLKERCQRITEAQDGN